ELRRAVVHVVPATFALLPANVVATVRVALVAEATLSFLGLGDPAVKSWGTMLGWAFAYPLLFASGAWLWWALPPAVAIALVLVATTLLAAEPAAGVATVHVQYRKGRGGWSRSVTKRSPRYTSSGSRPVSGATETRSP
ncbi:MAG TPA: hypothetical protein VHK63_07055, partial [Candidatus Limnocylindria bacterium]|nr:hypothetical protein [Candidatus Limnocylindria bacterium]